MVIKKTITDRAEQRLDNYLFQVYKATPNSHIYRMIRKGRIKINGKTCKDNTYKLQSGDELSMPDPINPKKPTPSNSTIEIVKSMIDSEHDGFWLLNKPRGFSVHQSDRDTFGIIEVMQHLYPDAQLVHRLDRNTTGCLLIAKDYENLKALQNLWKAKQVKKHYLMLCHGIWKHPETLTVSKPLLRQEEKNHVIVSERGKPAVTHFKKIHQYRDYVFLEAQLETGRTHQIRVHAKSIGHPILGDQRYSALPNPLTKHIFLHAASLDFIWRGEHKMLRCDMSAEQRTCLDDLN